MKNEGAKTASENSRVQNARRIRDVIRYIERFKNALVVIHLDDEIIDSPLFSSHIRDIALIHAAGLRTLIVPGARKRIDQILTDAQIDWEIADGIRVTSPDAMPLVKMAAFDVSNTVMTALAANHLSAVISNWVRARGFGIIDGRDFGTAGKIDKLQTDAIRTVLTDGFVPIFPCIGWSETGRPYNISSLLLAEEIAVQLQADKLFFVLPDAEINAKRFAIPEKIDMADSDKIPALNLDEVDLFVEANESADKENAGSADDVSFEQLSNYSNIQISDELDDETHEQLNNYSNEQVNAGDAGGGASFERLNNYSNEQMSNKSCDASVRKKIINLLRIAKEACRAGVSRVHIVNGSLDGALPCEIFSDLGSGTMIYSSDYGGIRAMQNDDVPAVLSLMRPFVDSGKLLPRTDRQLFEQRGDYIVYEVDGGIRACAALHIYDAQQAEIAAVAVDQSFEKIGIGLKLVEKLIGRARREKCESVFLLTTQAADWFERLGFAPDDIATLPEERKRLWTQQQRGSKLYRLQLQGKN